MASYETLYTILNSPVGSQPLWRQVYVAILKASTDIRNEAGATENHANRMLWAEQAEQDAASKVNEMRERVMENTTIQAAPNNALDGDIQFVVNSLIDTFATGAS